jgi:hypothetical protein
MVRIVRTAHVRQMRDIHKQNNLSSETNWSSNESRSYFPPGAWVGTWQSKQTSQVGLTRIRELSMSNIFAARSRRYMKVFQEACNDLV